MVTNLERPRSMLVILRRVYLNIVKGNHCAAKLIDYFKHWREWKLKNHRTEWIYQTLKQIHEDLMGEHSLHVIRAAIAMLEQIGILERRHNPNGQDKTWQYRLKVEVLEQLLNHAAHKADVTEAAGDNKVDECPIITPDAGTFRSEHSENTVEQQPQDLPSTAVLPTANSDAVGQKNKPSEEERPQPTLLELDDAYNKTRALSPDIKINKTVRSYICSYWTNFPAAIAYVKQALADGWCKNPAGLLVDTLKKGTLPESASPPRKAPPRPTPEQIEQLEALGEKLDYIDWAIDGGFTKVLHVCAPFKPMIPWWVALRSLPGTGSGQQLRASGG